MVNYFNGPVFFSHGASNSCGVLVAYLSKTSLALNKQKTDKTGRMLILDVMLDRGQYILIKLYNADTETEKCKIFNELQSLSKFFDINQNKIIIFAGDFNIFFVSKLETRGSKSLPQKKSIIKVVDTKESLDICDIWRIRNSTRQNFTFRQNHFIGFIECRLNYIFISNCLQDFFSYTDVLPAISTDHSPELILLSNDNSDNNGRGFFWKYNISLVYDEVYFENMKKLITKINTSNEFLEDVQMKWKFLKYKIQKLTIDYSKTAAKIRKQQKIDLEQKLKNLENNLTSEQNRKLYNHYKNKLETIYDHIADGIRIRSKCEWYELGVKFFLNLEKKRSVLTRIRKLTVEEKEITNHKEISKNIKAFYETLFKQNISKTNVEKQQFLKYQNINK